MRTHGAGWGEIPYRSVCIPCSYMSFFFIHLILINSPVSVLIRGGTPTASRTALRLCSDCLCSKTIQTIKPEPPTLKKKTVVFSAHRSWIKSKTSIKGYILLHLKIATVVKHYGVSEVTVMALVCSLHIWWSSRKLTYFPVWKQQLKIFTLLLGFFCFVLFCFKPGSV